MQSKFLITKAALALVMCSSGWSVATAVTVEDAIQDNALWTEAPLALLLPLKSAPALVPEKQPVVAEVSGLGIPLASNELEEYRGGFDLVKNDMQLTGTVASNTAFNVVSGNNSIADGAFANSSGFPMVIQNSGSNVLIQNATIINVQFQ